MSSKDMLLEQLDRVSAETMARHLQRPAEKISSSSVTLTLKAEGRNLDDSDLLINEITETQSKENVLRNGSVEKCTSERIIRTIESISVSGTDCSAHKMDFLSGFDASCTSHTNNLQAAPISLLGTSPDFHSLSDPIQSSSPLGTSSDKPQSASGQKTSRVLHVTDHPSDTFASSNPIDLSDPSHIQSSHPVSSLPTHNRSLSQTTSQLTNLKESAKSEDMEDTSHVNKLLHANKLPDAYSVNKSGIEDLAYVPSLGIDKPQISLSEICDLRTVHDVTSSIGHNVTSDMSHMNGEAVSECLPDRSQCSSMESGVDLPFLTHPPCPDWKLDRRESGHLFWRRDSSTLNGIDPSSRVKFRYDIEVHEFESRSSGAEDFAEDDDNAAYYYDEDDDDIHVRNLHKLSVSDSRTADNRKEDSLSLGSTAVMGIVAITAIIVMASYRWFLGILSLI